MIQDRRVITEQDFRRLLAKRLITEREFEALYGIKASTLRRWRLVGKGPLYHKLHGAVRYDVAEVEAWVKSCAVGTLAEVSV